MGEEQQQIVNVPQITGPFVGSGFGVAVKVGVELHRYECARGSDRYNNFGLLVPVDREDPDGCCRFERACVEQAFIC